MYHKEITTKKGHKISISIEKTNKKEKVEFVIGAVIIAGLIWWFANR